MKSGGRNWGGSSDRGNEESNASRTLFVRNLNPSSEDGEIFRVFSGFGDVKSVSYQSKYRGFVTVTYYDIRSSTSAFVGLQGRYLHGNPLDVYYSHEATRDGNQGALHVTFPTSPGPETAASSSNSSSGCCGASVTPVESDLFCECAKYGEVKSVLPSSSGRNAYVVEFYDLRAAENARSQVASVRGRPVHVEYAAPTGFVGSSAPLMADMTPAQPAPFRANATPFKPRRMIAHIQRAASASSTPFSSTPVTGTGPLLGQQQHVLRRFQVR